MTTTTTAVSSEAAEIIAATLNAARHAARPGYLLGFDVATGRCGGQLITPHAVAGHADGTIFLAPGRGAEWTADHVRRVVGARDRYDHATAAARLAAEGYNIDRAVRVVHAFFGHQDRVTDAELDLACDILSD